MLVTVPSPKSASFAKRPTILNFSWGKEARALQKTLKRSKVAAKAMADAGDMPAKRAEELGRNSRNLGELGIGLNPAAKIVGNMLEDEKVMGTCHIAIGANYDDDAKALIHLDGVVMKPTMMAVSEKGKETVFMVDGKITV